MQARPARLLAVGDQPAQWNSLRPFWEEQGLCALEAHDGATALRCVREEFPALVLLDLDLPDTDGLALLARLRAASSAGIIVVSSRSDEQDKVRGLTLGADDYVTKPFSAGELAARIGAVLRRTARRQVWGTGRMVVDSRLAIDCDEQEVLVAGQREPLRPTEYRLMYYLVEHAGCTMSFADILAHVWGPGYREEVHYVHLYVTYLRQKIEVDPSRPRYILTRRGVGYEFCALPLA